MKMVDKKEVPTGRDLNKIWDELMDTAIHLVYNISAVRIYLDELEDAIIEDNKTVALEIIEKMRERVLHEKREDGEDEDE